MVKSKSNCCQVVRLMLNSCSCVFVWAGEVYRMSDTYSVSNFDRTKMRGLRQRFRQNVLFMLCNK